MCDYATDLPHMKAVLMFAMRDSGGPSVTMVGTSTMLWLYADNWVTHLP